MNLIDITTHESNVAGALLDLINDHMNEYELTREELKLLDEAEELLTRIYTINNM